MNIDFSAQGITARLKRVSQLRRLCLSLGKAKPTRNKTAVPAAAEKKHDSKLK
jgi:hypothetical protein